MKCILIMYCCLLLRTSALKLLRRRTESKSEYYMTMLLRTSLMRRTETKSEYYLKPKSNGRLRRFNNPSIEHINDKAQTTSFYTRENFASIFVHSLVSSPQKYEWYTTKTIDALKIMAAYCSFDLLNTLTLPEMGWREQ